MVEEPFELTYDADDETRTVRGCVARPDGTGEMLRPAVLILHGFKGFFQWGFFPELRRRIVERGWIAVAFNTSSSGVGADGESFTEPEAFRRATPSRAVEDTERVRDLLGEGGVPGLDSQRLGLLGHSMGGGVALLHAAQRGDYAAVVTWAAVSHPDRYPPEVVAEWRARGFIEIRNARTGDVLEMGTDWLDDVERNRTALDIVEHVRRLSTPALVIHGTADESVPFAEGQALRAALSAEGSRFLAIEGAGHTFGAVHPFSGSNPGLDRVFEASLEFFERQLG